MSFYSACHIQTGFVPPSPSDGTGSGDVQEESHRRHTVDSEPDGEGSDRVPWSFALDEGCLARTGPRHLQTTGEISQGKITQI